MDSTMPPRCIHPALPFLLKKWIISRGENALNMALSYLIMLYTPMTAMEINHSRNTGANMTPTLAVPNRCTLKRSTKMTSEISVTTLSFRWDDAALIPVTADRTAQQKQLLPQYNSHQFQHK
jgi:hypothetical protein